MSSSASKAHIYVNKKHTAMFTAVVCMTVPKWKQPCVHRVACIHTKDIIWHSEESQVVELFIETCFGNSAIGTSSLDQEALKHLGMVLCTVHTSLTLAGDLLNFLTNHHFQGTAMLSSCSLDPVTQELFFRSLELKPSLMASLCNPSSWEAGVQRVTTGLRCVVSPRTVS